MVSTFIMLESQKKWWKPNVLSLGWQVGSKQIILTLDIIFLRPAVQSGTWLAVSALLCLGLLDLRRPKVAVQRTRAHCQLSGEAGASWLAVWYNGMRVLTAFELFELLASASCEELTRFGVFSQSWNTAFRTASNGPLSFRVPNQSYDFRCTAVRDWDITSLFSLTSWNWIF